MQSFKNHAHRPVLTGVGFMLAAFATVQFALLWRELGRPAFGAALGDTLLTWITGLGIAIASGVVVGVVIGSVVMSVPPAPW